MKFGSESPQLTDVRRRVSPATISMLIIAAIGVVVVTLVTLRSVQGTSTPRAYLRAPRTDWPMGLSDGGHSSFNSGEHSLQPADLVLRYAIPDVEGTQSSHFVADRTLVVVESNGEVAAFDADTGRKLHDFSPAADPQSQSNIAYHDGDLFMTDGNASDSGRLWVMNMRTGRLICSTDPAQVSLYANGPLLPTGDGIAVVAGYDVLDMIDSKTCEPAWSINVGQTFGSGTTLGDIVAGPGRVYSCLTFGQQRAQNISVAFDASTGFLDWRNEQDGFCEAWMLAYSGPIEIVQMAGSNDYSTRLFDLGGNILATVDGLLSEAVAGTTVYGLVPIAGAQTGCPGNTDFHLAAYDSTTGALKWMGSTVLHFPYCLDAASAYPGNCLAVANGGIYVATAGGLLVFDAGTGRQLAAVRYPSGETRFADVQIVDGMAFVSVTDANDHYSILAYGRNAT